MQPDIRLITMRTAPGAYILIIENGDRMTEILFCDSRPIMMFRRPENLLTTANDNPLTGEPARRRWAAVDRFLDGLPSPAAYNYMTETELSALINVAQPIDAAAQLTETAATGAQ